VQLGRVRMTGRFIVTNLLTSSPILLGTDFTVKFKISIAPHTKDQRYVTVGPLDDPQSRVPAFITNKISLLATRKLSFTPFEVKKVTVVPRLNGMPTNIVKALKCHKRIKGPGDLENSPFCLV
jgi:hypothetical protein